MNEKVYFTTSELEERFGRTAKTIYSWRKKKGFPEPVISGGNGVDSRYSVEEVLAWEKVQRKVKAA